MTTEAMKENQEQAKLNAVEEAAKKLDKKEISDNFDSNEVGNESLNNLIKVGKIVEKGSKAGGNEKLNKDEFTLLTYTLGNLTRNEFFWNPNKSTETFLFQDPKIMENGMKTIGLFGGALDVVLYQNKQFGNTIPKDLTEQCNALKDRTIEDLNQITSIKDMLLMDVGGTGYGTATGLMAEKILQRKRKIEFNEKLVGILQNFLVGKYSTNM